MAAIASRRSTRASFADGSASCAATAATTPARWRWRATSRSVLARPLVASTVSRLLVDLNRSLSNPRAWSEATRSLPPAEKQRLVRRHYAPHHRRVDGDRRRSGRVGTAGHSYLFAQLHARAGRARCERPTSVSCTIPRAPARRMLARMEGRVRRAGPALARAAELSVCRQGRRTDEVACAGAFRLHVMSASRSNSTRRSCGATGSAWRDAARVRRRNVASSAASPLGALARALE